MSSDVAIEARKLAKSYLIFRRPEDRLKQMLLPRLRRAVGAAPRHYFREFQALQDISFDIRRGETVGIIGRNGSGKSTLLQMICGTLTPTRGTVAVRGRIAALLELGAGFNREFTGRENVYLYASILGLGRREIDARFDQIADFADIGTFIDQPVKTYSSGMYMRLAFATAINVDPDILVVDEALAVGDEAFRRKCYARIETIQERGGTILFVSHGAQTILQLCSRAILLDAGELLLEGHPREVVKQYQMLINATPEAAAEIRRELRELPSVEPAEPPAKGQDSQRTANPASAWFDPNLPTAPRTEYESRGARIRNLRIETDAGERVNNLVRDLEYRLKYEVAFSRDAKSVAVGFSMSNPSGLILAGAGTSRRRELLLESVAAGDVVSVTCRFTCAFTPNTYFVTAGCSAIENGERNFLHRTVDACLFRVMSVADDIETGLAFVGAKVAFEKMTAEVTG